jgi:N-acylneuraminate cytidylyltransferase
MTSIAIITARGGSKRIPHKNIKDFCGKPIIAYSIEAALKSGLFDEVMVSTDSMEIADIAKGYGAHVPFLRSELTSNDYATTNDVLQEVLSEYEVRGIEYEVMFCIYPTAPFVTPGKLKIALDSLKRTNADSLLPVVAFSFPPQRGMIIRDDRIGYQFSEYKLSRSQDLEPMYHDCGQFYACKVEAFRKFKSIVTDNTIPLVLPENEVQDIDTESDWQIAEMKYRLMKQREGK